MTEQQIRAAYEPFAAALRTGDFSEPDTGWNAGQIGAHITLNNEMLSQVAIRLHDGADASYDNRLAVDDDGLLAYARELGDLPGVADAVLASAARLADTYQRLTPEERARPIPATIVDNGHIVRDGPMPLGDLIIGNGDFHLALHFDQLRALAASQ